MTFYVLKAFFILFTISNRLKETQTHDNLIDSIKRNLFQLILKENFFYTLHNDLSTFTKLKLKIGKPDCGYLWWNMIDLSNLSEIDLYEPFTS
jgi:hypothetical protein